jgi:hypothetical protein
MEHAGVRDRRWIMAASGAMFLAGVIHLLIVRDHWGHAPAHGIFFVIAGLVQIGWAVAFWRSGSRSLARVGFVLALGLIVLWGITRAVAAPFGHGPEEIETAGLVTKLGEIVCAVSLAVLLASTLFVPGRRPAWATLVGLSLLAPLLAGVTYEVALAAQPLLPALAGSGHEEHEAEEHEAEEHEQGPDKDHEHTPEAAVPRHVRRTIFAHGASRWLDVASRGVVT